MRYKYTHTHKHAYTSNKIMEDTFDTCRHTLTHTQTVTAANICKIFTFLAVALQDTEAKSL